MDSRGRIGKGVVFSLRALVVALIAVATPGAWALVETPDLYASLSALENQALKRELHDIVTSHHQHSLDYREARRAIMGELHLQESGGKYFIHDVYCQHDYTADDFNGKSGGPSPGKIPDDRVLNVEHTWPQSRFGGSAPKGVQKSDLHHLFPADSVMNSKRGNMRFGDVDGKSVELKCSESRLSAGPGRPHFEPPDAHKGNVARALFYFAVRYNMSITPEEEDALRDWNRRDPVDPEERERNDKIEKIQGNRNPFIDHPEYVDRINDF